MYFTQSIAVFLLSLPLALCADTKTPPKPCTIHSPTTGSFFDLRPLQLSLDGTKTQAATNESYHARGHDYPANFTMNFCGPVVEELKDVEGLSKQRWQNVSAYYKDKRGDYYSIGQQNDNLIFRGKKLVMNYTMGSPCPSLDEDGRPVDKRSIIGDDDDEEEGGDADDDDDDDVKKPKKTPSKATDKGRKKSSLLYFVCDTSPALTTHPQVNFLGSPDHCSYIFEVRSRFACAGATASDEKGTLGPGGVFGVILGIALLVYLIGGVVYQRNVLHQRGWRQIPNYSAWASVFSFISDMFIILFSSCTRHIPSLSAFGGRKGYHRVGTEDRVNGRGRRDQEAENRLIDSYDEEWDT